MAQFIQQAKTCRLVADYCSGWSMDYGVADEGKPQDSCHFIGANDDVNLVNHQIRAYLFMKQWIEGNTIAGSQSHKNDFISDFHDGLGFGIWQGAGCRVKEFCGSGRQFLRGCDCGLFSILIVFEVAEHLLAAFAVNIQHKFCVMRGKIDSPADGVVPTVLYWHRNKIVGEGISDFSRSRLCLVWFTLRPWHRRLRWPEPFRPCTTPLLP